MNYLDFRGMSANTPLTLMFDTFLRDGVEVPLYADQGTEVAFVRAAVENNLEQVYVKLSNKTYTAAPESLKRSKVSLKTLISAEKARQLSAGYQTPHGTLPQAVINALHKAVEAGQFSFIVQEAICPDLVLASRVFRANGYATTLIMLTGQPVGLDVTWADFSVPPMVQP